MLNTGVVGLALFRRWRGLGTLALAGTQVLFWVWYAANYHPEKLGAAVVFQVATFALFLTHSLLTHVLRPRTATIEDLVRLVLNAFSLAIAAFVLLDKDYHLWMGTLGVVLAILYTALGWLVLRRRPEDQRQLLVVVSVALSFIAVTFPLQASAAWIAVGWAVEALALWWFGCASGPDLCGRWRRSCCCSRLAGWFWSTHRSWCRAAGSYRSSTATACRRRRSRSVRSWPRQLPGTLRRGSRWPIGRRGRPRRLRVSASARWFCRRKPTISAWLSSTRSAGTALSGVWAAYAGLLLAVGFRLQSGPLRWSALALFGVTLAKVILIDMSGAARFLSRDGIPGPGPGNGGGRLGLSEVPDAAPWRTAGRRTNMNRPNVRGLILVLAWLSAATAGPKRAIRRCRAA